MLGNHPQRIMLAMCALAPFLLVTGCGPAQVGFTGIAKSSTGELLGVVQVCRNSVDTAVLEARGVNTKVRWHHSGPVRGFSTWPLVTGGDGWKLDGDSNFLREDRNFNLIAVSGDSATTVRVDFNQSNLATLSAGNVLYFYSPPGSNKYVTAHVSSVAEFQRIACSK